MTIFDILSSLIFTKRRNCLTTVDEESMFVPYMVNRWLSMYSTDFALICNRVNKYMGVFDNKQDLYSLFFNVFPQVKQKRIQYFKKVKVQEQKTDNDDTRLLAKSCELSQREIRQYIDFLKT